MTFRKKILVWGSLAVILYFLLSYHFIFFGISAVKPLKKSKLTLEYTFFNAKGKTNKTIMAIDDLRNDGIADLLVEMGMMSEEEKESLMALYEETS